MLYTKKLMTLIGVGVLMLPTMTYGKTLGTINADVLNVRKEPSTTAQVVTKLKQGEIVEINEGVSVVEGWTQINIAGYENPVYIRNEHFSIVQTNGVSNSSNINIRSYPSIEENSKVIGELAIGQDVEVLYKVGNFYKIYFDGKAGFVYSQYIDIAFANSVIEYPISEVCDLITGESITQPTNKLDEVVQIAKKYLGNPYVYGGTSLTNGTDCSGFTKGVYQQLGITIPRTSREQSTFGTKVATSNLQKGDLLFFGASPSSITHVGMYIGGGKMIHASSPKTGIIISDAYKSGGNSLQVARRII